MQKLNIFVSSTCYDLSQIRTDLRESLSDLGYNPILSEFPNFPINPANTTVENCIEVVNSSADVFVLIIGSRYGFTLETGKSITNMEYLTAKSKGIPTYVFISKQVVNLLPVYLQNKDFNFSNIVDNPQIFEFVNEVRNESGLWTFEYDKFQDIIYILKSQLSYLFQDALKLRNKLTSIHNIDFHNNLSNKALKIILEKDTLFEYLFLTQTLLDEINKNEFLKKDYTYKIVLNSQRKIADDKEFVKWVGERLTVIKAYIFSLTNLINNLIPKYLNEPGKPADLKGLYYVAQTYGKIYESFLNWSINVISVSVSDNQLDIRDSVSEMASEAIEVIWNFPFDLHQQILEAKQRIKAGESNIKLKMGLTLEIPDTAIRKYNKALESFERRLYN